MRALLGNLMVVVGLAACGVDETLPVRGTTNGPDRKSTRLNSSHRYISRMPSSA
jgi:hypothetical protein